MTIEGRPYLGPDMTYGEQRKCRMQDAIDDYLQDDTVDVQQMYDEILSCIQDVVDYHKINMDRAFELKSFMMGHRVVDDIYDEIPERY